MLVEDEQEVGHESSCRVMAMSRSKSPVLTRGFSRWFGPGLHSLNIHGGCVA